MGIRKGVLPWCHWLCLIAIVRGKGRNKLERGPGSRTGQCQLRQEGLRAQERVLGRESELCKDGPEKPL